MSEMPSDSTTGTRMRELCEVCGDAGARALLLTCARCKLARQHVYCLKTHGKGVPNVWVCDACEAARSSRKHLPKTLMLSSDMVEQHNAYSRGGNNSKREKIVKTGKVIYLPVQELITHSSRANKVQIAPRSNMYSSARPSNIVGSTSAEAPTKPRAAPPKSLPVLSGPRRQMRFRINSDDRKQITQRQKDPTDKNASRALRKNASRPQDAPVLVGDEEKLACKPSYPSSVVIQYPPITSSDKIMPSVGGGILKINISDAENGDEMNIQPNSEKCFLPALDSFWKGGFKICDSVNCMELNYSFEAHLPSQVGRKVYEFSKRMPAVLQFELLPRCNVWADIFQNDCPHEDDIGLYFFSIGNQRSADYLFLPEIMVAKDLVMISYIYGVELLVFPSKLLPAKSQRWNDEYFLWGILRCMKKRLAVYKLIEEPPRSLIRSLDCTQDNHAGGDDKNARMTSLHGLDRKFSCVLKKKDVDHSARLPFLEDLEGEDIPPGFEKIHRQRQMQKMHGKPN